MASTWMYAILSCICSIITRLHSPRKRRRRHAVDPSLGYWLGPSSTPKDCPYAPIHCQTPIVPHGAPAVEFNLATVAERPRISKRSFAHNVQIDDGGDNSPNNPPRHSTSRMIDEEHIRTVDRASPSLLPCHTTAPIISPSPPAVHDVPSQRDSVSVEQFLRVQSRARKPVKRRNYKRRQRVAIQLGLEPLKEANSSFLREEDQLLPGKDDNTLALPTKWRRKAQTTSGDQTTRKRRRTRKAKEETKVIQPLELQEEPVPNIATHSLHEHWYPVDSHIGKPFIQPTLTNGRHRVPFKPLKPAPIPPPKWTNDALSDGIHNSQNLPLTKEAPGEGACPSARMSLSMEPTEDHERKLKLWKRSVGHLRRALLISLLAIMFKPSH